MVKEVSSNVTQLYDEDDENIGRPPHEPTPRSRAEAESMASHGVSHRAIAAIIGVSINTLRKHYMAELILGDAKVQVLLGQTSVRLALGGPAEYHPDGKLKRAEVAPDKTLLIFLLKTRNGLSETLNINNLNGIDDAAREFNTVGLSQSERAGRIAAILDAAAVRRDRRVAQGGRPVGAIPGETPGSSVPK